MVAHDIEGYAILAIPKIKELGCKVFSGNIHVCQSNMNICTKMIHDGYDTVKAIVQRQWSHKINGN